MSTKRINKAERSTPRHPNDQVWIKYLIPRWMRTRLKRLAWAWELPTMQDALIRVLDECLGLWDENGERVGSSDGFPSVLDVLRAIQRANSTTADAAAALEKMGLELPAFDAGTFTFKPGEPPRYDPPESIPMPGDEVEFHDAETGSPQRAMVTGTGIRRIGDPPPEAPAQEDGGEPRELLTMPYGAIGDTAEYEQPFVRLGGEDGHWEDDNGKALPKTLSSKIEAELLKGTRGWKLEAE